jgi:hypothetical protein
LVIEYLREQGEDVTQQVVDRLKSAIGEKPPHLWRINLCEAEASAVVEYLREHECLTLGELIRNPYNLEENLSCIAFAIDRDGERIMIPGDDEPLCHRDEILMCGTEHSETMLSATMNNAYTLHYLVTGTDAPRGYLFQWLARQRVT